MKATDWKVCPTDISVFADIEAMIFLDRRIQMKNFKGFALGLVLGIGLAFSSVGFTQKATQTADQKKEMENCCAAMSCCKGDSCDMKMKHDAKDPAAKGGCCCCGDSCDMKMKHDEKPKS